MILLTISLFRQQHQLNSPGPRTWPMHPTRRCSILMLLLHNWGPNMIQLLRSATLQRLQPVHIRKIWPWQRMRLKQQMMQLANFTLVLLHWICLVQVINLFVIRVCGFSCFIISFTILTHLAFYSTSQLCICQGFLTPDTRMAKCSFIRGSRPRQNQGYDKAFSFIE